MGILDHELLPYRYRAWSCVVGGVLVMLTLGTLFSFGNMIPYVSSYIRAYGSHSNLRNSDCVWLFALGYASEGIAVLLGGFLYTKIGSRWTTLLGCWLLSAGVLLTTVTITASFYACLFTYGVMYGIGAGIAYAQPMASSMRWLPDHKGLVNGIILAGYGGASSIFVIAQTELINPDNESPSLPVSPNSTEKYYSPIDSPDVLARTPRSFLILGGIYAGMQLIGSMLVRDPPPQLISTLEVRDDSTEAEGKSHEENAHNTSVDPTHVIDVVPREALKTRAFYTLWGTFFANGMTIVYITSLYKAYGQTFIDDDKFLAILGAVAAACNAGGRILWGIVIDKLSYRVTMSCLCASSMVFMATLIATPYGGKAMFFVWVCALFFCYSGNYVILPTVTARIFGSKHVGINYGMIYTSQAVIGILGTFMTTMTRDTLGWNGMFGLVAGFALIGLLLSLSFNMKREDGRGV